MDPGAPPPPWRPAQAQILHDACSRQAASAAAAAGGAAAAAAAGCGELSCRLRCLVGCKARPAHACSACLSSRKLLGVERFRHFLVAELLALP